VVVARRTPSRFDDPLPGYSLTHVDPRLPAMPTRAKAACRWHLGIPNFPHEDASFGNRKGLKIEMTKISSPPKLPMPSDELRDSKNAARQFMINQKRSECWNLLSSSVPVRLMSHRNGMCRWPIGDPHRLETFFFCGCACSLAASYCEIHEKMAATPYRPRTISLGNIPRK
jgi:hypothetical protein